MSVSKDTKTKTWIVQLWYKDFTGKRRHTTKRGFATKRDAEKYEREFLCADHPEEITIGALITKFEAHQKMRLSTGEIRNNTYEGKQFYIDRYIKPYFSDTVAVKVTTNDINEWLHTLITKYPSRRGSRLSSETIKSAKQMLSQVYEYGIINAGLTKNPVEKAMDIPHFTNDKRAMWTKEQFVLFHNALYAYPGVKLLYDIIYASGLRLSEALGLTPNDITQYKISVVKGAVRNRTKKCMEIHKPKTESSTRDVEIPRSLYYAIFDYIADIPDIKPTDRIFPFTDRHCRDILYDVEKRLNLPHSSPHMLRHLYASTIYANTKDLTVVASQLGHASIDVTAKVYVDMIKEQDRKTVDDLENILTIK